MFLYYKLRTTFLSYYLLAIAASIIILSGVGSANIMFISMGGNDGTSYLWNDPGNPSLHGLFVRCFSSVETGLCF